jgi:Ca2+-binding RTX toxin-like protein
VFNPSYRRFHITILIEFNNRNSIAFSSKLINVYCTSNFSNLTSRQTLPLRTRIFILIGFTLVSSALSVAIAIETIHAESLGVLTPPNQSTPPGVPAGVPASPSGSPSLASGAPESAISSLAAGPISSPAFPSVVGAPSSAMMPSNGLLGNHVIESNNLDVCVSKLMATPSELDNQVERANCHLSDSSLASATQNDPSLPINNLIFCTLPLLPSDICLGTINDDQIVGTSGTDIILARAGNDAIQGGGGDDVIFGEKGDDTIQSGGGADRAYGMDGNDFLYGDTGGNAITGGGGNYLDGGNGNDVLVGSADSDVFVGGTGKDYFDCNEGTDQILDFDEKLDTKLQNCEFY